jgi:aromatic-L-amino-acid decarboxylase
LQQIGADLAYCVDRRTGAAQQEAGMDNGDFRGWSQRAAAWGADYRDSLGQRPVRAQTAPGAIARQIPDRAPEAAEPMEQIFADFERVIVPGMTHWQHSRFFAYFPANAAPVSVVAEYLVSAMAAQCMLWQTSPAATELETRVMIWMRQALGLPEDFTGVIHDTASGATLAAVLTMREKALAWTGNRDGLAGQKRLRVYASRQGHSSIDRAIWISGIGEDNLVRVAEEGPLRAMQPAALEAAIVADLAAGHLPCGIIACVGATGMGACDDIAATATIARKYHLHLHVDAAWAGSAMICEEFRSLWTGVEQADSLVFNPHKWLGAQFDCSVYFVRDPDALVKTLAIKPEYLKHTRKDASLEAVINYSEWSVPLGRRFRALKLWFLLRAHGLEGLRAMIRNHVGWARDLADRLAKTAGFEIVTAPVLSLFTFRYVGDGAGDIDQRNRDLISRINDDGRIYLTQTLVDGKFVIRFQAGAFTTTAADVAAAYEVIVELAGSA